MRQQAFKMGYFHWLGVKNSNNDYLHAEFSPATWETQSFILKTKLH